MRRTGQIPFRISILISTMRRAGLSECQGDTPQPYACLTDSSPVQGLKKRYDEYPDAVEPHPANKAAQFVLARRAAEACQESLNRLQVVKPSASSGRSLLFAGKLVNATRVQNHFLSTQCYTSKLMISVRT